VYIKLVVLLRNYVTMMHGQQNIKNGWATIVVVGRLRVKTGDWVSHSRWLRDVENIKKKKCSCGESKRRHPTTQPRHYTNWATPGPPLSQTFLNKVEMFRQTVRLPYRPIWYISLYCRNKVLINLRESQPGSGQWPLYRHPRCKLNRNRYDQCHTLTMWWNEGKHTA
jgi:hypothetical protein